MFNLLISILSFIFIFGLFHWLYNFKTKLDKHKSPLKTFDRLPGVKFNFKISFFEKFWRESKLHTLKPLWAHTTAILNLYISFILRTVYFNLCITLTLIISFILCFTHFILFILFLSFVTNCVFYPLSNPCVRIL